jgi:hypothetical protein
MLASLITAPHPTPNRYACAGEAGKPATDPAAEADAGVHERAVETDPDGAPQQCVQGVDGQQSADGFLEAYELLIRDGGRSGEDRYSGS